MTEAALILGVSIILATIIKFYQPKSKRALVQVNISGITDHDGEQMHLTTTLLEGESVDEWQQKILAACELREWRLRFVNQRMLKIQEDLKAVKEADLALKKGLRVVEDKA